MDAHVPPTPDFEDLVCSGKEYQGPTPPFNHIAKENIEMRDWKIEPGRK